MRGTLAETLGRVTLVVDAKNLEITLNVCPGVVVVVVVVVVDGCRGARRGFRLPTGQAISVRPRNGVVMVVVVVVVVVVVFVGNRSKLAWVSGTL